MGPQLKYMVTEVVLLLRWLIEVVSPLYKVVLLLTWPHDWGGCSAAVLL